MKPDAPGTEKAMARRPKHVHAPPFGPGNPPDPRTIDDPRRARCAACGEWPHLQACQWRGAGLVRCGPWIVCAECGYVLQGIHTHRAGCTTPSAPGARMPADAAPAR